MKLKDIDCPPYAPVLMESTRAIGYSIEAAIADIIDNSIAAKAKNIDIFFDGSSIPYVMVMDDGVGMTDKELTEAMRYGSCSPSEERDESDLGRYGLGLKTASLSQCRQLSVITKQNNQISGRRWDLDYILDTKSWSLQQLSTEDCNLIPYYELLCKRTSGTAVLWKNLDKIKLGGLTIEQSLETKMEDVREHLELVFHRYLSGDGISKIVIRINSNPLVPFDPFFVAKSTLVMDDEKIEVPGRKGKVIVRPYVLPHPSKMTKEELEKYGGKDGMRNLQGFYIYRNKRLLTWGTWFKMVRMDEFSKLARVRVDIPNSLDDLWTLDIKKSTAYPPEIVKARLKQLVGTMTNGSKRTWNFRKRQEITDGIVHVWNVDNTREGVKYSVNLNHPILETINEKLDGDSRRLLKQYLETIQNNLPFNNLHYDMHSDAKIAQDKEDVERERVCYFARELIKEALKNDHIDITMEKFETTEPFLNFMEDIKRIYAEVRING